FSPLFLFALQCSFAVDKSLISIRCATTDNMDNRTTDTISFEENLFMARMVGLCMVLVAERSENAILLDFKLMMC
ncbi:MAG: hypothetical protein IKD01_04465, partial [Oscillospiraceae bacterium]|nr:hypothetical protein [Oscillospiraceae bacterium]